MVGWVQSRADIEISILFTPWGEALIHRHYQRAIANLSHLRNVSKVAIQTNLSCRLDWLAACDKKPLGLWTTYHPSQTRRERFLAQCRRLDKAGIRYSVGMVGLREDADEIRAMTRRALGHG